MCGPWDGTIGQCCMLVRGRAQWKSFGHCGIIHPGMKIVLLEAQVILQRADSKRSLGLCLESQSPLPQTHTIHLHCSTRTPLVLSGHPELCTQEIFFFVKLVSFEWLGTERQLTQEEAGWVESKTKASGWKCAECTKELHPLRLGEVRAGSQGCDQGVLL